MTKSKHLVIVGAGGHGQVVADAFLRAHPDDSVSFVDKSFPEVSKCIAGEVKGKELKELDIDFDAYFLGIGDNEIRRKIASKLADWPSTIICAPSAIISDFTSIESGSLIMHGALINCNSHIGLHCIINTAAIIEHDCSIGNFCHIAPGAVLGGGVTVGDNSLIGIGATVMPYVKIGQSVTVGAGSVVCNDIPDGAKVVGAPAKPILKV